MQMHKYEVVIHWSETDHAFIAEAPQLPGCIAHGDTRQEAVRQIDQAIRLWTDTAREFGDPVPEPEAERISLT